MSLIEHYCPEWDFMEININDREFGVCICDCNLARRVFRIGVQTLLRRNGKYYVSIKNRTYFSEIEIPQEKVQIWKEMLT